VRTCSDNHRPHPFSEKWVGHRAAFASPLPVHPAYTPSSPAPSVLLSPDGPSVLNSLGGPPLGLYFPVAPSSVLYSLGGPPIRPRMGGVHMPDVQGFCSPPSDNPRSHPFWEKWVGHRAYLTPGWPATRPLLLCGPGTIFTQRPSHPSGGHPSVLNSLGGPPIRPRMGGVHMLLPVYFACGHQEKK